MRGIYGGLDLAASRRRASAVALVSEGLVEFVEPSADDEIVTALSSASVVAIDSPLTPPPPRGHRAVDRLMIRMGYRVLPASWPSMRSLYERASRLAGALRAIGVTVVETHPSSAMRAGGCRDHKELAEALGLRLAREPSSRDEVDSLVAAAVAMAYAAGRALRVVGPDGEVFLLGPTCGNLIRGR